MKLWLSSAYEQLRIYKRHLPSIISLPHYPVRSFAANFERHLQDYSISVASWHIFLMSNEIWYATFSSYETVISGSSFDVWLNVELKQI